MRTNILNPSRTNLMRNVINMLNSRASNKTANTLSAEQLIASLPQSALESKNMTNKPADSSRLTEIKNSIIALSGGTSAQKIQAASDTLYYEKRYSRTDEEVLSDILSAANTPKTSRAKEQTVSEDVKQMTPEEVPDQMRDIFEKVLTKNSQVAEKLTNMSALEREEQAAANREIFGGLKPASDSPKTAMSIAKSSGIASGFLTGIARDIEYITDPADRSIGLPSGNLLDYTVDENEEVISGNVAYNLNKISAESLVNIDCKIDDLSALYAFSIDKAAKEYSGDELEAVSAKLDEMFKSQLDWLGDKMCIGYDTHEYFGTVGSMTEKEGAAKSIIGSGDEENIRSSIEQIFEKRSSEYTELLKSESFNTGVSGTDNEWAEDNAEFMVHKLHQQIGTSISDIKTDAYTSTDLKAFNIMQLQYTVDNDFHSSDLLWGDYNSMNEEAAGAYIGMIGIQTRQISDTMDLSDKAKELLNKSFEKYAASAIDYAEKRKTEFSDYLQAKNGFSELDVNKIKQNIAMVMSAYSKNSMQDNLRSVFADLAYNTLKTMSEQYASGRVDCRYENINSALSYYDWFSDDFYIAKFNAFEKMIGNTSSIKYVKSVDIYA